MKILHTADWHLGKQLEGHSRMDEQEAFLDDFVSLVEKKDIDIVIIAGDIYDASNPPARAEKMFYETLKRLSSGGKRLTLVIAGNHDNPQRLVAAGPLAKEHGIIMVGTLNTIVETGEYGNHKVINSAKGMVEVEINGEKAVILTVAYPSEKRLNEVIFDPLEDEDERLLSYTERIDTLFRELEKYYSQDSINILVSHLFAMGSENAGSERSIELGGSYIIDGKYFPKEAQYIALGHIHKLQIVPGTDKRARYSGSPIHYSKREINFDKKCFAVELKAQEEAIIEEVPLKVYKPIEIWKCKSIEEAIEKCEKNKDKSCWTYLEIDTDRYIREDELKLMRSAKKDIIEVIPNIKNEVSENMHINNIAEKSFEEIFREFYLKERGSQPTEELVEMLLEIVKEDEYETAEAEA